MDDVFASGFRHRPIWLAALALVLVGQAGLILERFGGWRALRDDRPMLDGRHPLHLYHGKLGAETFRQRYSTACYDPAFQAGYPKTPVFDGGCRPAEFVLTLLGTQRAAAVYKLGVFILGLLVPLAFAAAARGLGVPASGSCLTATLGSLLWFTQPVQALHDAGKIDVLLAGLTAVVFVAWLSRYHWDPGPTSWLMLAGTAAAGWYAQPVVWLGMFPVLAGYYIAAAPRHGPAWHIGFGGVAFCGVAPNMWWLWDWGRFWWLRQPSVDDVAPFPTWGALLGQTSDNLALFGPGPLGWMMAAAGLAACGVLLALGRRSAAGLSASAVVLTALTARLGEIWPPFINGGADRAALLANAFAILPTAAVLAIGITRTRFGPTLMATACALPLIVSMGVTPLRQTLNLHLEQLRLGLNIQQQQLVEGLARHTQNTARILIEDQPADSKPGWNWTALLPTLLDRSFLGGLDPDARFEHAFVSLNSLSLNGRALSDWTNAELEELATRYNLGWVLVRSGAVDARMRSWPVAWEVARFQDDGEVVLYALARPHSFVLAGHARWEHADRRKVVLTDVIPTSAPHPDGGPIPAKVIVLSLHYQPGIRVSPNIVLVERDPCPHDPIPMIRLRMSGPLSRIVLSWENR